ncbi:acyltransferase, partial [Escherichia coli]|nr:acyltransferase [Escherichia coli]
MFHWIIISKLMEIMQPNKNDVRDVIFYIVCCLGISIFFSIISFKLIEMPANKIIRNAWAKMNLKLSTRRSL